MSKKISIAVANYNNEKYLKNCLDKLLNQVYQNIEVIVVNDGSPGNCDEIMEPYLKKDKRIKYIKHDKNKGLFQARLTGAEAATGDYIAFLDADDYTSVDFYHSLLENAEKNGSDIVIGNVVLEYDNGKQEYFNMFEMNFKELNKEECLGEYFRQEGLNFSWHTGCNQLYSMKVWKKAEPYYKRINKRLLMTEDFAFSTVLFYFAEKVTKIENECLYYCKHGVTSTSINDINYNKEKNNINDLITSFGFVEEFLKEKKIYNRYKKNFESWKHLYASMHRGYIKKAKKLSKSEKEQLNELMNDYCSNEDIFDNVDIFSSVVTEYDNRLNELKKSILDEKIKCVSFDIFDTLVLRPFFKPLDLFKILDKEYQKNSMAGISFSKMRVEAECVTRNRQWEENPDIQEITIDQIYKVINELYEVDTKVLNSLKEKEKQLEIEYCRRRNTAYELYLIAKYIGKKVVCTSDMYLSRKTIETILDKNGYKVDSIYISSDIKKTKATGDLFKYVLEDLKIKPEEMIHIGDNVESDFKIPHELGINSYHFAKPVDRLLDVSITNCLSQVLTESLPFWFDTKAGLEFFGIRTMLAVVANKYFDNPYRSFNKNTDFNADPYLIGYYALGMYSFGITKWLINNLKGKYDKISFMARDGYLIKETYNIMKKVYNDLPETEYMYVSRKALIPIIISNKLDFYKLSEIINIKTQSPKNVLKYLKDIIKIDENKLEKLCKKHDILYTKEFESLEKFNSYIRIVVDNFYNEKEHQKVRNKLKDYFNNILGNKPAVFDVGYSGRPEFYLSMLCGKSVDTYFLNINADEALDYSKRGNFELKTFFPAKPTATGNAYELLLSKLAPSCIGYDCSKSKVEPVFEEYKSIYQVDYIVETMQIAAKDFVSDMVDIFGDNIDMLYYQDYYVTLPILSYFNAAQMIDRQPLSFVAFEDEIRSGGSRRMIDDMLEDLNSKNQSDLHTLFGTNRNSGRLNYSSNVDLNGVNKFKRLLYYSLFDKKTLKRRVHDILYNFLHRKK